MYCQGHGIDSAYRVNGTDVIYVPVGVDNIFGDKFELLNAFKDAFCLVTGIDDHCLERLWAGV